MGGSETELQHSKELCKNLFSQHGSGECDGPITSLSPGRPGSRPLVVGLTWEPDEQPKRRDSHVPPLVAVMAFTISSRVSFRSFTDPRCIFKLCASPAGPRRSTGDVRPVCLDRLAQCSRHGRLVSISGWRSPGT